MKGKEGMHKLKKFSNYRNSLISQISFEKEGVAIYNKSKK